MIKFDTAEPDVVFHSKHSSSFSNHSDITGDIFSDNMPLPLEPQKAYFVRLVELPFKLR